VPCRTSKAELGPAAGGGGVDVQTRGVDGQPKFYEPQRLRKSTWDTQRLVRGHDVTLDDLVLPRGLPQALLQIVERAGSRLGSPGAQPRSMSFSAVLKPDQAVAVSGFDEPRGTDAEYDRGCGGDRERLAHDGRVEPFAEQRGVELEHGVTGVAVRVVFTTAHSLPYLLGRYAGSASGAAGGARDAVQFQHLAIGQAGALLQCSASTP
jgi:hypothetical protein